MHEGLGPLADRLEGINEELDEMMFDLLREAVAREDALNYGSSWHRHTRTSPSTRLASAGRMREGLAMEQ